MENLRHQQRGEAHGGFIHQQDLGLGHQGAAHREHLLFTAGKRPGKLGLTLFQTGEKAVNILEVCPDAFGVFPGVCAKVKVLRDGLLGEDSPPLRNLGKTQPDNLVRSDPGQLLAVHLYASGSRMKQTGNRMHGRGLAGAVRADQGDDLSVLDVEGNPLDGLDHAIIYF